MTPPRRVRPITLVIAFALLAVMLLGMVLFAMHQGQPVRFGLVPQAQAFGAAHLVHSASSQYTCTMYENEEIVLRALRNRVLDAALVSVPAALALPQEEFAIRGVFSVTDLLVLSDDETLLDITGLSGRTLILPAALSGSKEESMLRKLLGDGGCVGCELLFSENPAALRAQLAGSVLLCPMDSLESTLRAAPDLTVRFRLSSQWRTLHATVPPAGLAVVCRRDILDTGTCLSFEKSLRSSMTYADRKRKKTVAMAVEAGLFDTEKAADQLIDHMSFSYHEGEAMEQSLQAWQAL